MRTVFLSVVIGCLLVVSQSSFLCAEERTEMQKEESAPVQKDLLGWIEKVVIHPYEFPLHAKLDTGADFCSLGATEIKRFKRGGKSFASFKVRNRNGAEISMEAPVIRTTRIKRLRGSAQERLVVRLNICLGAHQMEVDVNLIDRSNFSYRMLIGRNFLSGNVIVDSSSTYLSDPVCKAE